jgi:RHS repeat-associated protein
LFLHGDLTGSVRAVTNAGGALVAGSDYTVFGRPVDVAGLPGVRLATNFGYAGEHRDPTTGLVYLRARWLDPATGLFLSVDPAEVLTGDAYGYAAGNPSQLVDPLGLWPGWLEDALKATTNFVYGVADELTMGLASTIVDGLGVDTEWLDSCSSAFQAGQTAAVVGELVVSLVTTGGAATALVIAKTVARQGLKTTLKAAAKTAGHKAAELTARALKTTRGQTDNLGAKTRAHWDKVKNAGGDTGSVRIPGGGKTGYWRGTKDGEPVSFAPSKGDFRIDHETGFVQTTHGVSVFDNPESVRGRGFTPHEVDTRSVPPQLRVRQRGNDPHHFEIRPVPGASLTPQRFEALLSMVRCFARGS